MRGLPTARPRGGRFSHPLPRFPDRAASSHPRPGCGARLPTCAEASLWRPRFPFSAAICVFGPVRPCERTDIHADARVGCCRQTNAWTHGRVSKMSPANKRVGTRVPAIQQARGGSLPHPTSNNRTQQIPKRHARRARRASCALRARCGACLRYHGCDQRERTNHAARNAPTEEHRAGFRRMGQ